SIDYGADLPARWSVLARLTHPPHTGLGHVPDKAARPRHLRHDVGVLEDLSRDFRYGPRLPSVVAWNRRVTPALSSFILSGTLTEIMLATPGPSAAPCLWVLSLRQSCSETPPLLRPPLSGP